MIDWPAIRMVAFDIDGTLYAQRPLRIRMAARLVAHSLMRADVSTLRVLRSYRDHREQLSDDEVEWFEDVLIAEVGRRHGLEPDLVRQVAAEWLEERPLPLLARFRFAGVAQLFDRVRRSGRIIGVLSDYPAQAKLKALGLAADHVVSAIDVGYLKPHPAGLERLMEMAGVSPGETLLIGDRAARDGEAARRAGAACLLRTSQPLSGWPCFASYEDALFKGVDTPAAQPADA